MVMDQNQEQQVLAMVAKGLYKQIGRVKEGIEGIDLVQSEL